jgi:hypothetical protein
MKIEKLQPGQISVERQGMGNIVFRVHIVAIDPKKRWVLASWNGNIPRRFSNRSVSKWREKKPNENPTATA